MKKRPRQDNGEPPEDDLVYEDFDDLWEDEPDPDLEALDLEALDDEIEPVIVDDATGELLETIAALDDAISPAAPPRVEAAPAEEPLPAVPPADEEAAAPDAIAVQEPLFAAGPELAAEPPAEISEAAHEAEIEDTEDALAPADILAEAVEEESDSAAVEQISGSLEAVEIAESPAAEEAVEEPAEAEPAEEAAPPDLLYRVLLALPEDLAAQVEELRALGEIADMPPPGIELLPDFRAEDLDAVRRALQKWARAHLPLQLELDSVQADVIGARQYVAAWTLQQDAAVNKAQRALQQALAPLAEPVDELPGAFQSRIVIGEHAPAGPFPHLIGEMQRRLEPLVWHAELLQLVCTPAEAEGRPWEIAATFD